MIVVVAALVCLTARGQDLFPAPGDQRALRQEYLAAGRAYEREAMLEAYRAGGGQDERWDGLVERFIDGYAALLAEAEPPLGELLTTAREILQSGCEDAAVSAYCATVLLENDGRSRMALRTMTRVLNTRRPIEQGSRLRLAASWIAFYKTGTAGGRAEHHAVEEIVKALSEPGLSPLEERWIVRQACELVRDMSPRGARHAAQAFRRATEVSRWASLVLSGVVQFELGWKARGTGFADTVTPEGAAEFDRLLAEARPLLEAAHELDELRPEAATYMIGVATGQSAVDEIDLWFSRAIAAQFDYPPAYRRYMGALRPRWHGSLEQLLEFAGACAETGRFDTVVPAMAYEAAVLVADDLDDPGVLWRIAGTNAALRVALRRTIEADADKHHTRACRERLLALAWHAGDWNGAAEALAQIKLPEGGAMPRRAHTEFDQIRSDAALRTSGIEAARQALDAEERQSWDEAERLLMQAEAPAAGAELMWAIRDRLALARFQQQYARRRPVALPVDPDFAGWRRHSGSWRVEDGAMVGRACGAGAQIYFAAALGEHYIVEATIDIDRDDDKQAFSGAIILDGEPFKATTPWFDSVRVAMDGVHVGFREETGGVFGRFHDAPLRLRAQRDGEELKVWAGEQLIAHGRTVKRPWSRSGRLGFAVLGGQVSSAEVRITEIEVMRVVPGGEEAPGL